MQVELLNEANRPIMTPFATAWLEAEIALRTAANKIAALVQAQSQFEKDVILPAGWFGYPDPEYNQVAMSPDGKWVWNRPTEETGSHPFNFQESRGMVLEAVSNLGTCQVALREAHERVNWELCNVRVTPEGGGK